MFNFFKKKDKDADIRNLQACIVKEHQQNIQLREENKSIIALKNNIDGLQSDLSAEKGLTSSYLAKTESQSNEVRLLKLTIDEKEKYIAKLKEQLDASQSKVAMQHQEHLDRKNKIETLSSSVLSLNKKIEGNDRKTQNIQRHLIDEITHRSGNLSKAYVLEVIEKSFRRNASPAECVKDPS